MSERLLLTGATGFVGRNMLLAAVARGDHVIAPVRDAAKLRRQLEDEGVPSSAVTAVPADPAQWPSFPPPDRAVLSAGTLFARSREEYFRTNVDWNLAVLDALGEDVPVVLLSSQSAGGPTPAGCPARTEQTPDTPVTEYGKSKLELERRVLAGERPVRILRPPMILGARDTATLPLFRMAAGAVRLKPGLGAKFYTFVSVGDVVRAIDAAFTAPSRGPYYIGAAEAISDLELIACAARLVGGRGVTLRVPEPFMRVVAAVVDAVPALRTAVPSLGRDRVREIWPSRWVVDASAFRSATGWTARESLDAALGEACAFYRKAGMLDPEPSAPAAGGR